VAIVAQLRLAGRKGDRAALALALDHMRTLAYSPRYWRRYLDLLQHPLARLVDLTVIKQGEKIARQKGWEKPRRAARRPTTDAKRPAAARARPGSRARGARLPAQPSLFPELS
jgi:hypothetical protein